MVLGLVYAGIILAVTGIRAVWISDAVALYFLGEIFILGIIMCSSLYYFLLSAIPGESYVKYRAVAIGGLFAWFIYLVVGMIAGVTPELPLEGISCLAIILLGVLPPIGILILEARRGMPLAPAATGSAITLSAVTFALLGLEAHCRWESAFHHLIFHFVPAIAIFAVGFLMSRTVRRPTQSL